MGRLTPISEDMTTDGPRKCAPNSGEGWETVRISTKLLQRNPEALIEEIRKARRSGNGGQEAVWRETADLLWRIEKR